MARIKNWIIDSEGKKFKLWINIRTSEVVGVAYYNKGATWIFSSLKNRKSKILGNGSKLDMLKLAMAYMKKYP